MRISRHPLSLISRITATAIIVAGILVVPVHAVSDNTVGYDIDRSGGIGLVLLVSLQRR